MVELGRLLRPPPGTHRINRPSSYHMWLSLTSASNSSDLVVDATLRTLPSAPVLFIVLSVLAGLLALTISTYNARQLRQQARAQAADILALRTRERRLRQTVRDSDDGLVHLEPLYGADGEIVDFLVTDANTRAAALFRRGVDSMLGLRTSTLASLDPNTDLFASFVDCVQRGATYRAELRAHPRFVATSWVQVRAVPMDTGLAITLSDIRDRKREAARLRRASQTDELTGLVNRRGFLELAERQLADAQRLGHDTVLFYLDCDAFKLINDCHGHPTGDRALKEIARSLRFAVRETDIVARMGGDEFTILATDAIGSCADTIRTRIYDSLDALNAQGVLPMPIGVSIGHVYAPAEGHPSLEDLLESADRDLLVQKRARRVARAAMQAINSSTVPPKSPRNRRTGTQPSSSARLTGAASAA